MPFLKAAGRNPSRSASLENKCNKCGRRATLFSVNGDQYTGEWLDDNKHGWGIQVWKKSGAIYNGEWKCGKRDGYGSQSRLRPDTNTYENVYCGQWKNGMKHGDGVYFFKSGCGAYEGEWREDQRSGWGRMLFRDGDVYEGEWTEDKEHGFGIRRYANGNRYEGSWRDGEKSGTGKLYFRDQGQLYRGLWVRGELKCGTLEDLAGAEKCPIPQVKLVDVTTVLQEAQSAHFDC
ncbi:MORN repeat-containing protein 3-like isoform X2 [Festucalex cinctus]